MFIYLCVCFFWNCHLFSFWNAWQVTYLLILLMRGGVLWPDQIIIPPPPPPPPPPPHTHTRRDWLSQHTSCKHFVVSSLQAPLHTPVTADKFAFLTETARIPLPILPGELHTVLPAFWLLESVCVWGGGGGQRNRSVISDSDWLNLVLNIALDLIWHFLWKVGALFWMRVNWLSTCSSSFGLLLYCPFQSMWLVWRGVGRD